MSKPLQFHVYFKVFNSSKSRIYRSSRSFWFIGLFILFQSFLCSSSPALYAQLANTPWPMFMHDVQHTGQSPLDGPQENTLYWQYQNGFFEFADLDADKYMIKAKKKRHRPAKKTVEIKEGESKKIEIELRRISNIRIFSKRH